MRHNILLIGCLGAALLTASLGHAAHADTPASHAASPSSGHTDSHASPPSGGAGSSHASSGPSPTAHADGSHASGTPSSPAPAAHPAASTLPPPPAVPPALHALPDYGGRDGIAGTTYVASATPALNPLAQAWRAFEALAIVLALVVGGLYALKRLGVIRPDGSAAPPASLLAVLPGFLKSAKPAAQAPASEALSAWMTMLGSQTLPNAQGASLHLVSLGGKTLLIGATSQSVSLISEVDAPAASVPTLDTGQMPSAFDGFLMQADHAPQRQSNETELLMNATTMRLQAMIARSEGQAAGHRS